MNDRQRGDKSLPANSDTEKQHMVERFLAVQEKEIDVKFKELEIRKEEIDCQKEDQKHNKDMAEKAIDAQLEDSRLRQTYFLSVNLRKNILIGFITLIVFGFLIAAMVMDKEGFAERVMDIMIGGLGGFAIGYFVKNKPPTKDD